MKSPLFISAIELLAHSTELFALKKNKKNKFIILHLANSVELILKDKLITLGVSIYEKGNSNRTIGVWECFKELDRLTVQIPERPVIELLIDDRNTIQHRFGYPNEESVYFYLDQIVGFFKRFLTAEYNVNLLDELKPHLPIGQLELLGLVEDENHHLNKLKDVSIEMAILNAYGQIEKEIYEITQKYRESKEEISPIHMPLTLSIDRFISTLMKNGNITSDQAKEFSDLKNVRNKISHGRLEKESYTKDQLEKYFVLGKEILSQISNAKKNGFFTEDILKDIIGSVSFLQLPKEIMLIEGVGEKTVFTGVKGGKFYINAEGNRVFIKVK